MKDCLSLYRTLARKYPQTTPQDAVKLAYQSVYGCGHLIDGENSARVRDYLARENADFADREWFTEDIGCGHARLYLGDAPAEAVFTLFSRSAERDARFSPGETEQRLAFQKQLALLSRLAEEGYFSFTAEDFSDYVRAYWKTGLHAVHHSDAYRTAYAPAYRVIRREYVPYLPAIFQIYRTIAKKGRALVAIDGMAGSGKSGLAALLSELVGADVVHMDDFFLPPEKRTMERLTEVGGNVDYERFSAEVLPALCRDEWLPFTYRIYDCGVKALHGERRIGMSEVRIVEGSYALHPTFGKYYDFAIFLHTTPEEQMRRILKRNGNVLGERFRNVWIPRENAYFREKRIAERCRYVIRNQE